jgi:hypothetical protein
VLLHKGAEIQGRFDTAGRLKIGNNTAAGARLDIVSSSASAEWGLWVKNNTNTTGLLAVSSTIALTGGQNGSDSVLILQKATSNNRSINAAGTINASGADYAEYEQLADGIKKPTAGTMIGWNKKGLITTVFDDALDFGIVSTEPNLVGGDKWSQHLGDRPMPPAEPTLPEPPLFIEDEHAQNQEKYDAWQKDCKNLKQQYQQDYENFEADLAQFQADIAECEAGMCIVAYCGTVPVLNAPEGWQVGDWLIPAKGETGEITAKIVSDDDFDLSNKLHRKKFGRIRYAHDGLPIVAVGVV